MERHFERDLGELKQRVLWMGSLAERAVRNALCAVLDLDEHLAETVILQDSLKAVVRGDPQLARSVLRVDDQMDRLHDQMFRELLTYMMENPAAVFAAFELILVAKNLERIGDHATHIAEDVIYFVVGRDVRHPALDRPSVISSQPV
jgi:phosphate uptake regulator